jgi:dipeptidyl aminopeptidase/acylaminoacyl peptidase
MKFKIRFTIVLLILAALLVACGSPAETPVPPTDTPAPAPTDTPAPAPTDTPEPAPTDTPEPAPTDTPEPAPTDTPEPAPTDTPEPAPTDTSTPIPVAKPASSALTGQLFFSVFDETAETYNIYSAKPDGSDLQLLVKEASQPGVRADGKTMLYRSWQGDRRGLFEYDLEAGVDIWQFDSHFEAGRPSYFPDNKSYLFHSREAGEEYAVYKTDETEYDVLRREAKPIEGEAPALTPDGKSFVYKTCIGTKCGLYFSNIDGSSSLQLTEDLSDTNPAVSPDGQTVAFMSERSGNWDVYTVSIDGGEVTQLTNSELKDGIPTWSPDGRTIAFASDREDGVWAMWAMNADGSNQRKLFDLDGPIDGKVALDVANARGWLEENIVWIP